MPQPKPSLADVYAAIELKQLRRHRHVRTTGIFSLPADAVSVDWAVVSHAPATEVMTVTVFNCSVLGPKTPVAPGPLTISLDPNWSTHNANSVGPGQPFEHGFFYEVVIESNDLRLLPTAMIWLDRGNTVIPGTSIQPADWVEV